MKTTLWRHTEAVPEPHAGAYCVECRLPFRMEDLVRISATQSGGARYLCGWHAERISLRGAA